MVEELKLGMYRHFKGGMYEVLGVARDCEDPSKKSVIYKSLYEDDEFPMGTIWYRSLEYFVSEKEIDGGKVKRYEYLGNGRSKS